MELTLAAAAHLTGKGKSTLLRAVKSGKLSARRTEEGAFMVDASELARVFPMKTMERVSEAGMVRHDASRSASEAGDAGREVELAELRVKVAMQAEQLERERETIEDLRKRLDDEKAERRALQRQITSQVSQAQGTTANIASGGARGFLQRVFGLVREG